MSRRPWLAPGLSVLLPGLPLRTATPGSGSQNEDYFDMPGMADDSGTGETITPLEVEEALE